MILSRDGFIAILILFFLPLPSFGESGVSKHLGYLDSIEQEYVQAKMEKKQGAESTSADIKRNLLFFKPPTDNNTDSLGKKIFSQKLSNEFSQKYRERFGYTEAEQLVRNTKKYAYYNSSSVSGANGFDISLKNHYARPGTFVGDEEARQAEVRRFGTYMTRRMVEFHIGEYAKDKPMIQKVQAFKEKYSKAKVKISSKVNLRAEYLISSNDLKIRFENPWIKNVIWIQFDDQVFGPKGNETTLSLYFPEWKSLNIEAHFKFLEKSFSVVGRKQFSPSMSATLSSQFQTGFLDNVGKYRQQEVVLAGVNWNY